MTDAVVHSFVSPLGPSSDPDRAGGDEWNDGHVVTYGALADIKSVGVTADAGAVGLPADAGHVHPGLFATYKSGAWYGAAINETASGASPNDGDLYAFPFDIGPPTAFDLIGLHIIAGETDASVKLAIYADAAGVPGAQIILSSEIPLDTSGDKTAAFTLTLSGRIWLAARFLRPTPVGLDMSTIDDGSRGPARADVGALALGTPAVGFVQAGVSGDPADPFGSITGTGVGSGGFPAVQIRAA